MATVGRHEEPIVHGTAKPGQVAARVVHWLALAEWAGRKGIADAKPAVYKMSVLYAAQSSKGPSPLIRIRPIGRVTEVIEAAYGRFGIQLGDPERVKQRGYALLRALREAALEKRGRVYAVRHVGAWLAFAAVVKTLLLGDGDVSLTRLRIGVKERLAPKLAEAVDGYIEMVATYT